MNKYKLKIVEEDGMYVGYALENDEVKAKTAPCRDSVTASRNLSILIGRAQAPTLSSVQHTLNNRPTSVFKAPAPSSPPVVAPTAPSPQPQAPRRSCCGRG